MVFSLEVRIFIRTFADERIIIRRAIRMSVAFKNRTRSEVIAAFRESIRKKNECMQRMNELMQEIRREEQVQPAVG